MAAGPLTLLDIAIRSGTNVQSIVEDVITVAPEWGIIPATTRQGVSYDVLRRTGLPHGQFRPVGGGVPMLKSEFARETKPMAYFDCQIRVGQDIVQAQTAQSTAEVGDILADEAMANVRGSAIYFGEQTWYGTNADQNGFMGVQTMTGTGVNNVINLGGASGASTSAYLLWLDTDQNNPKGVHFVVGLQGAMTFGEWLKLQAQMGTNALGQPLYATVWCNGFSFYIGLNVASAYSAFAIHGIDPTHPLTDAVAAAILASVPLGRRANLRWFMNRYGAYSLQTTRSVITIAAPNIPAGGTYAAQPTELAGYPITITDAISSFEVSATGSATDGTYVPGTGPLFGSPAATTANPYNLADIK